MRLILTMLRGLSRMILTTIFFLVAHSVYAIQIRGLEHDPKRPHTYYAMLHKRDDDPIVILPVLLAHRGWQALAGEVRFALRADAFAPGFLAWLARSPRWLARLLRPINVGPVLRFIGGYPLEGLAMRPLTAWLRDVLAQNGNVRAGTVFTPTFIAQLASRLDEAPEALADTLIARLLTWRYYAALLQFAGLDIFSEAIRRPMKHHTVATIRRQLNDIAAWFQQGGALFGSPEGVLSPDGRLSPISGGFHRVIHAGPADACVVPIATVYDFMTTWRPRAFVTVAAPILAAPTLTTEDLDARLVASWRQHATITYSHLASDLLMQRSQMTSPVFTRQELADEIRQRVASLVASGRQVDEQLLHPLIMWRRSRAFLTYAQRHGIISPLDNQRWHVAPIKQDIDVPFGEVGFHQFSVAYAWNELHDILSDADEAAGSLSA